MRVYFVRHGESEANTRHVISNRESSFHLTSLGQQQAQTLASGLRDIPFRAVFCSPVLRARETANILSASLNIPCQVTEALREYDCGILEEKSDDESWKLHRYYFNEWMSYRNYESAPEGDLLLVGHGGLFLLMLPLILMNIENRFVREHGIGHTECIVAESTMDGFICRQWGDVQF